MDRFYKLARFDGWDFYTGRTINYRNAAQAVGDGKWVRAPKPDAAILCTSDVIHASRDIIQCFQGDIAEYFGKYTIQCCQGAELLCSAYVCEGNPVIEKDTKCGFYELNILEEIPMASFDELFGFQWSEAIRPINPFRFDPVEITDSHLEKLKEWAQSNLSKRRIPQTCNVIHIEELKEWAQFDTNSANAMNVMLCDGKYAWLRRIAFSYIYHAVWDSLNGIVDNLAEYTHKAGKEYKYIDDNPYIRSANKAFLSYQASMFDAESLGWDGEVHVSPAGAELWRAYLVPTYDGEMWRLHGGKDAGALWEGKIDG